MFIPHLDQTFNAVIIRLFDSRLAGPFLACVLLACLGGCQQASISLLDTASPRTIDGYRGIWFSLGQYLEYGDKYSGGLGTYTAKHHPLAYYAPEVDKTFFVYGGTTAENEQHLLAMISYYDHASNSVPKPVVVHDKEVVDDPHDNPSLNIDADGHLWVFVSGRGSIRPGFVYRSTRPFDISSFELLKEDEFAYPQPWFTDNTLLFLFTQYTDGRELYWRTHADTSGWSPNQKLAAGGHYQMSNASRGRVITAFNSHFPNHRVDARTNLSFLSTSNNGASWQTANGTTVKTPLDSTDTSALVRDYQKENKLVYLKDINFDTSGNPVLLYITSKDFRPGPSGSPRIWTIAHWKKGEWLFHDVAPAYHNYDMGSLYVEEGNTWRIIAPLITGPQPWGTGGEIAVLTSFDEGKTWQKAKDLTADSPYNHGYARRPVNAHPDFYAFWADGNPDSLSTSHLYFTNRAGQVRVLPYHMNNARATPEIIVF